MEDQTIYPSVQRASPTRKAAPPVVVQLGTFWAAYGDQDTSLRSESHSIMHMLPGSASLGSSPGIRIRAVTPEVYRFWTSF